MDKSHEILSVKHLKVSFTTGQHHFTAIENSSFSLKEGKTLAVVGESGSGKSLTALAIMGLLPSVATVNGNIQLTTRKDIYQLHEIVNRKQWEAIRGKEIGMIFQEPMSSLNPVMKIGEQLSESIQIHQSLSKRDAIENAINWLGKVKLPQPEKIYHRYPHELSGGQKQRVMIAMAMCNAPVLLIADEPTTALDVTVQQEIIKLMKTLQQDSNTAMIFITHDLSLAASVADDVMVMHKGEVVEYGIAAEVLENPQHLYTRALIACKPAVAHKGAPLPVVADFLLGKEEKQIAKPAGNRIVVHPTAGGETILCVKDLRVWFSEEENWLGKTLSYFKAVDDVSFNLQQGEILGLVGESGCGKSTLSRSLIGLLPVKEGQIFYKANDITTYNNSQWKQLRKNIQMIFQDPYASLNPRMTIGDILTEPMKVHRLVKNNELKKEVYKLLDMVQLPADAFDRYPHQFSGGQRQRIGIARALALKPELIICDESVSALDVSVQAQILNLLKELQKELHLSYLFISHDLSVVHYISDRVMVMQNGKIVETGDASQVLLHPQNSYTQKLVSAMP